MGPLFDEIDHLINRKEDTADTFNAFFAFKTTDGFREKNSCGLEDWDWDSGTLPMALNLYGICNNLMPLSPQSLMRFIQGNQEHWPVLLREVSQLFINGIGTLKRSQLTES